MVETEIVPRSVVDEMGRFFRKDEFYNPGYRVGLEEEFALDGGVVLEVEFNESYTHEDVQYHQVEMTLYFSSPMMDGRRVESRGTVPLQDVNEYGQKLQADIDKIIGSHFDDIKEGIAGGDLFYRGEWRRGFCYKKFFDIPEESLIPSDAVDVEVGVDISKEFSRRVPRSAVEEDDILEYVVKEWWSNISAAEKARALGMNNETIMVEGPYKGMLEEEGVEMSVELVDGA